MSASPIKGPPWTPEENNQLRALALSGASAATIARQMNRSEGAVRKRAVRLNIVLAKARLSPGLKVKGK
jgi:hypothetical protein